MAFIRKFFERYIFTIVEICLAVVALIITLALALAQSPDRLPSPFKEFFTAQSLAYIALVNLIIGIGVVIFDKVMQHRTQEANERRQQYLETQVEETKAIVVKLLAAQSQPMKHSIVEALWHVREGVRKQINRPHVPLRACIFLYDPRPDENYLYLYRCLGNFGSPERRLRFALNGDKSEGVVGHVFAVAGEPLVVQLDGYGWNLTPSQQEATKPVASVVAVPILNPSDETQATIVGVLSIDSVMPLNDIFQEGDTLVKYLMEFSRNYIAPRIDASKYRVASRPSQDWRVIDSD